MRDRAIRSKISSCDIEDAHATLITVPDETHDNATETLHIRMPRPLAKRIRDEARIQRRSVTQVVNILLSDVLERQETAAAEEPRETVYEPVEQS